MAFLVTVIWNLQGISRGQYNGTPEIGTIMENHSVRCHTENLT